MLTQKSYCLFLTCFLLISLEVSTAWLCVYRKFIIQKYTSFDASIFCCFQLKGGYPPRGSKWRSRMTWICQNWQIDDECRANAVDLQEIHLGVGPGSFVTPLAFNTPLLYECSKVLQMLPRNNHERLLNASSRSPCSTRVIKPKNHNSQIT